MHFTDLFIRRPVLAIVVSLFILVLGLRSIGVLNVREYPFTQNAVVTVQTVYFGADPALIAGFITSPLENSIAQANGIDYLSSSSLQGVSTIQATLRLNYDPAKAMTEINTRVHAVLNQLPKDAQQPVITLTVGEPIDSMYIGFYSKELPTNKITDYLFRVVQPKLQAVEGCRRPRSSESACSPCGPGSTPENGGLRPDRHGREQCPGRQRFHLRRGPDEGADGHRGAHGRHGSSQRRGIP